MKKYIYRLLFLLAPFTFVGCMTDEGNYDYHDIVTVTSGDANDEFSVNQYDSLIIEPKLNFSDSRYNADDFNYHWVMYLDAYQGTGDIYDLSDQKDLHVVASQPASLTPYALKLYVTNKSDSTISELTYHVTINATISSGILALYQTSNGCDFDYIATPNAVSTLSKTVWIQNALTKANNGQSPDGTPRFISAVKENRQVIDYVYVATDKDMKLYSASDFSKKADFGDQFYATPTVWNPSLLVRRAGSTSQRATLLINDGKLQAIPYTSPKWEIKFTDPYTLADGSDYDLIPYIYICQNSNYSNGVSEAGAFYDNKGKRFLKYSAEANSVLEPFPTQVGAKFDVNNIGLDCRYLGYGYNAYCYSLLTDGSHQYVYTTAFNMLSGSWSADGFTANPDVDNLALDTYDVTSSPEIADAKYFDLSTYAPVLYYATEDNIYACNLGTTISTKKINDDFSNGEKITAMMYYHPDIVSQTSLRNEDGTLLYVATWDGSQGRIYEFPVARNTGEILNTTDGNSHKALNVFTVPGRVCSMCTKIQGR